MQEKQKFCQFDVAYTVTCKLTNDFCILEKFNNKKDIQARKDQKDHPLEGEIEYLAICFALNQDIECHYETEIKFFPIKALMNED
jgi:hypothetical protein